MSSLPLLNFTRDLYPDIDLQDVSLIACQHLLETTLDLFDALFSRGLRPQKTYILGKCYSTNEKVMKSFGDVFISPLSTSFNPSTDYDQQFKEFVHQFVDDCIDRGVFRASKKIIVLDDGGFLIQRINEILPEGIVFSAIEQTSSGFERLKNQHLQFGVVNVARSDAKLRVESPLIARSIVGELKHALGSFSKKKILVVGQGAIGRALKKDLEQKADVFGCDSEREVCDFSGKYKDNLATFDVIIGATGKRIFSLEDVERCKEGAIFVSASSSDREFPAAEMRNFSKFTGDCHSPVFYKGRTLLNAGFPLNFTGDKHSLPPEDAQLIRSLLFAGVCEATKVISPGLHDLSSVQERILEEFTRLKSK